MRELRRLVRIIGIPECRRLLGYDVSTSNNAAATATPTN
jgi:hypothetical protein